MLNKQKRPDVAAKVIKIRQRENFLGTLTIAVYGTHVARKVV